MANLREMLTALGLGEARTLLQSGNAVFQSQKSPAALEAVLEEAVHKRFGFFTHVFVRTEPEWEAVVEANPFSREAKDDPSHLLVMPLKDAPDKVCLAELRRAIQGRERVDVVGRVAYLVYPDGVGRSKLTTTVIESRLFTQGTARNWNTVQKLLALARGG